MTETDNDHLKSELPAGAGGSKLCDIQEPRGQVPDVDHLRHRMRGVGDEHRPRAVKRRGRARSRIAWVVT